MGHFELLRDAKWLCSEWTVSARWPVAPIPWHVHWEDAHSPDSHTVMAWTDGGFDPSWMGHTLDAIREACILRSEIWTRQIPYFADFIGRFFCPNGNKSRLQMISVTPSRVPKSMWSKRGRPILEESLGPTPRLQSHQEPLKVILDEPLILPINGLLWADRGNTKAQVAVVHAGRRFNGKHSHYWRAFEYDHDRDSAALSAGSVPAVADSVVGTGDAVRTHAPMIQLWKLDDKGWVDLLNLETSRDSGLMADIRWTHQRFADLMEHDPYYVRAFALLKKGAPTLLLP